MQPAPPLPSVDLSLLAFQLAQDSHFQQLGIQAQEIINTSTDVVKDLKEKVINKMPLDVLSQKPVLWETVRQFLEKYPDTHRKRGYENREDSSLKKQKSPEVTPQDIWAHLNFAIQYGQKGLEAECRAIFSQHKLAILSKLSTEELSHLCIQASLKKMGWLLIAFLDECIQRNITLSADLQILLSFKAGFPHTLGMDQSGGLAMHIYSENCLHAVLATPICAWINTLKFYRFNPNMSPPFFDNLERFTTLEMVDFQEARQMGDLVLQKGQEKATAFISEGKEIALIF